MKKLIAWAAVATVTACGASYISPSVNPVSQKNGKVRVVPINGETVLAANQSAYEPQSLPSVFFQTAGTNGSLRGAGRMPEPVLEAHRRAPTLETRIPPEQPVQPYRIGVGDVVLLATPQATTTVEQLSGLLAASNARQGFTVQDDGTIAIPNMGRVAVSGLTLEEAEDRLFERMVENQIDPTFSLEIAEFNSKRVSVGGAVANPTVVPVTLTPLFLDELLAAAGGISAEDEETTTIRIYRDGTLYQIPAAQLYSSQGLAKTRLQDGDSVFVDTAFELELAQAYFEEQIQLARLRQSARATAITELRTEVDLRRAAQNDARQNYLARLDLDSVDRDYVYLTGEVETQSRYPLPFGKRASLADALYSAGGGVPTRTGNVREIYVLRASPDPRDFGAVTAWQLDARQATNITLATRFELRPNDVIFVAEQPITRWNRVVSQITPSLITLGADAATN